VNAAFSDAPRWGFGVNGLQVNPTIQGLASPKGIYDSPGEVKVAFIAENVAGAVDANNSLAADARIAGEHVV
jgi:hypothetical protein